jgi:hypothetical protein
MKLEKLNLEQKELLKINKEKFIKKFLNNDLINKEISIKLITFVYSLIGKKCPKIYKVGNPLEAQQLANKLKKTEKVYYVFGTYLTIYWASLYAYYETFVDLGIITKDKFPKYFELRNFIDSNIFLTIEFEKAIIICEKPLICLKNQKGLHNLDGMAIQWRDGYGQYYFNGINVKVDLFNQLINKTYTFEQWTKEQNEEIKSLVLAFYEEKFGGEFVFSFLSKQLKEIDSYIDKKDSKYLENTTKGMNIGVYTLFKGKINKVDIAYVRCYCPSTDRMFFLGVHPDMTTAKDAIASLCQVPVKLAKGLTSINRQGEMFSFNFDKETTKLLKTNTLTSKDYQEVVSLKGDEYFNKIKFEF